MRRHNRFVRIFALVFTLVLALCAHGFAEGAYTELKLGDAGDAVRALQERLQLLGYFPTPCDGVFGADMEEAVVAFNKVHGLSGSVATADMQAIVYSNAAIPFAESGEELLLTLESIADGVYAGTLSGDSYTSSSNPDEYTITPDIAPAELTLTLQGGQARLYCAASATAGGTVFGVETPRSPTYTQTVSGSLVLRQVGTTLVYAEGDLTAPGEGVWVYWNGSKQFTGWEVEAKDCAYHCTVSITMANGVPTAEVVAAGSASRRACTIPLALRTSDAQEPAPDKDGQTNAAEPAPDEDGQTNAAEPAPDKDGQTNAAEPAPDKDVSILLSPFAQQPDNAPSVLWTNANASAVKNDARDYYVFCDLPDCTVTKLETCHFLSSGKAPGQLMLYGADGGEYGPYQATGRDGQDGAQNAYWVAAVSIDLPAGRYAVADSDQATWSNNDETDGFGMATVYGVRREQTSAAARQVENADIPVALSWSVGSIRYSGAIDENGQPHGYGEGFMEADADGASWRYKGAWEHGHLNGEGELTGYTEHYVQSGTFENDDLNGYGCQHQDGVLRYEGDWRSGELHGQGKLYAKTGELLYEGAFEQSRRKETPKEAKSRTAAFRKACKEMGKKWYGKWKNGDDLLNAKLSVTGKVLGITDRSDHCTIIIPMNGNTKYNVALSYRYAVDEEAIEPGDKLSVWGYCVGSFEYSMDGKTASAPLIEVVYLTKK